MRLDSATIYQIFWLAHLGYRRSEIAKETGASLNSINWHLSGRFLPSYPPKLRQRISPFAPTLRHPKPAPDGFITLAEASYFFYRRPTVRTLLARYPLRTRFLGGRCVTRWDWAKSLALKTCADAPAGVSFTADAAASVFNIPRPKTAIVQLATLPPELSERVPAPIVHAGLGINAWTEMHFVTLTALDVLTLTGRL